MIMFLYFLEGKKELSEQIKSSQNIFLVEDPFWHKLGFNKLDGENRIESIVCKYLSIYILRQQALGIYCFLLKTVVTGLWDV